LKTATRLAALAVVAACGETGDAGDSVSDGAPATPSASASPGRSVSSWLSFDDDRRTASLSLVAGDGSENDGWNYNGHAHGSVTVVVPEGFEVTIDFTNKDPANHHSVAVLEASDAFPVSFDGVDPVFEGAATSGATSSTESTALDESETIGFLADRAGSYAFVCLVPAHAATGMWIGFEVASDGGVEIRRGSGGGD